MKKYFKYKFGYINIDDHNIYLTNSGNWQDCRKLEEKSFKTSVKTAGKRFKIGLLIAIVVLVIIINLIISREAGTIKIIPIIVSILSAFGFYRLLMPDLGSQYLISIESVISFESYGQDLTITSKDSKGKHHIKFLERVEHFEWESIEELRRSISSSS